MPNNFRQSLLYGFLISVAVNAALGIWALLVDDFGQTQGKILGTSFLVSAAMLSVLVNGVPVQRRSVWPVPVLAVVAAVQAFALIIGLMWAEGDSDFLFKLAMSGLVVGAGGTLAGFLGMALLRPPHRLLQHLSLLLVGLLSASIVLAVWVQPDREWFARYLGVVSVLVAALTLTIPVLARFWPAEEARPFLSGIPEIRFCPSCGVELNSVKEETASEARCRSCGVSSQVHFPEAD